MTNIQGTLPDKLSSDKATFTLENRCEVNYRYRILLVCNMLNFSEYDDILITLISDVNE